MSKNLDQFLNFTINQVAKSFNKWYQKMRPRDFEMDTMHELKEAIRNHGEENFREAHNYQFKWYGYNYQVIGDHSSIAKFLNNALNKQVVDKDIQGVLESFFVESVDPLNGPFIGLPQSKPEINLQLFKFDEIFKDQNAGFDLVLKQLKHFCAKPFYYIYEESHRKLLSPDQLKQLLHDTKKTLHLVFGGYLSRIKQIEDSLIQVFVEDEEYANTHLLVFCGFEKVIASYVTIFGTGNLDKDIENCESIVAAMSAYVCQELEFAKICHTTSNLDLFIKFADFLAKSGSKTKIVDFNIGDGSVYTKELNTRIKGKFGDNQFFMIRLYHKPDYDKHFMVNKVEYFPNAITIKCADNTEKKQDVFLEWLISIVEELPNSFKISLKTIRFLGLTKLHKKVSINISQENLKDVQTLERNINTPE